MYHVMYSDDAYDFLDGDYEWEEVFVGSLDECRAYLYAECPDDHDEDVGFVEYDGYGDEWWGGRYFIESVE